jgi:hypothetical protein
VKNQEARIPPSPSLRLEVRVSFAFDDEFPRTTQINLTKTSNGNNVATKVLFTNVALKVGTSVDQIEVNINGIRQYQFTLDLNASNEVIGVDFGEDLGTLKVTVSWLTSLEVQAI